MTWIFPPLYYPKPRTLYTRITGCTRANIVASIGVGIPSGICPRDMSFSAENLWVPDQERADRSRSQRTQILISPTARIFILIPAPHKLYTPPIADLLVIWQNPPNSSYTKQILIASKDGRAPLLYSPLSSSPLLSSALSKSPLSSAANQLVKPRYFMF
ncbi:hypothetical protein EV426DRAFT_447575 [Tirmania nivea]|nr:hypothetical protein EV426DRAFT_447575 [Tirmania nivea]